jgi:DNA polymerase III alpha subunit
MKISPHTHPESPLTGSTLANLIKQAKDLGRSHFAYTDNGHLSSCLKAYSQTKKAGLKFIPGIEIYFKDTACPIVTGTPVDRCKYFTTTIYCKDQIAYQELTKLVSSGQFSTMEIHDDTQQIWTWKHLETISKFNVEVVLGGVHCMVGKPMLAGHADLGQMILTKLKGIFGDRLSCALLCEPWVKKYSQVVEIECVDGTRLTCMASDQISTDRARRIRASDLIERSGHTTIKSLSAGNVSRDINKEIKKVKLHKGFLPLPGGDVTLKVNKFLKALSSRHNIPVLATDYAYYAKKEDKIVQTMRLEGNDKLQPNLHMKDTKEVQEYLTGIMGLSADEAARVVAANEVWAAKFDAFTLKYDWHLAKAEGDPLRLAMEVIRANGRMRWDDPKWVSRLKEELEVIAKNPKKDLTAYFLPIRDVLDEYKKNGLLTGPGRGSAGGSLFCYLLGITQVDPFEYDLPFQRFFSLDRILMGELPDIDVDLEDRTLLVGEDGKSGYLYGRWGDKAAQISTRTTIRLKSAIKDTNRYFKGKVEESIEIFTKGLPAPPQGVSDLNFVFGYDDTDGNHILGLMEQSEDLRNYVETRPEEWEIVSKAMGLTRAFSSHASAFVLSDEAIQNVVPTKQGHITQYEAKECEAAGLIKYDFLVINQLKDIRVCMDLINKKNGEKKVVGNFTHQGKDTYIWKLPHIEDVFKSVWGGSTETCFQINTRSMVPFVKEILPSSVMDLATILALVRPGPMDFIDENTGRNMVEEYVLRRKGESEPDIKELSQLLPETYGIITFQEQLNKIARDLAGFPGQEAETLRKNMSKKKMIELMKMKPAFIEGAKKKVSEEVAEGIWDRMITFGRYGFSIIHAVEYALITYACMFLKHYYPLEWWAAILTNATEQEITGKFWPYVKDIVSPPDINLSGDTMVVDYANEKIRAKLGVIRGMGDATLMPIVDNRPYKDIQDFVNKQVAGPSLSHKLIHVGVLDSLFPAKTSLNDKLKMFQDAVEIRSFTEKKKKADATGKKMRALEPKQGVVPEGYTNLHPIVDAAMKKSVLPSMPISTYDLGARFSKVKAEFYKVPKVISQRGYETLLINGETLQQLDEVPGEKIEKDIYVASTGFVVKSEEFSFPKKNPTKRALKMVLDVDGYVSEKVLWPDYDSGQLTYPAELKKGAIITVFFRKKAGRKDMSIQSLVVES